MATNSSRGNTIGAEDGPAKANTPKIPAIPDDLKTAILATESHHHHSKSGSSSHGGLGATAVHEGGEEDPCVASPKTRAGAESKEDAENLRTRIASGGDV